MGAYKHGDDETLDYSIDWADWLSAANDTISASSWVVPDGLTGADEQATSTSTSIFLSGGTVDELYEVTNVITTAAGRVAERTIKLLIVANKTK